MDHNLSENLANLEKIFDSRLRQYDEKLQKVTTGSNVVNPDIAALSREFYEFKNFIFDALKAIKQQLQLLTASHDRHETAMRRKVLLFHGIPESQNSNPTEEVQQVIAHKLKLNEFNSEGLVVCHRLGSSSSKTRPILVRFNDYEHRHLIWENKSALKGSGVTISEFLTRNRHSIFMAARRHFGIKNCWSSDGKIIICLPNKSRRRIETESELHSLIELFPSSACDNTSEANPIASAASSKTPNEVSARGVKKTKRRV
ncbi:unnamed protein product [Diatraea saccharalis]|uniref:Uncharacterized protein n=1 Tax=Diatraea saccharalis TaxID=40085 RepID=A0A9N9R1L4_9NEOP|nr:unnamed protein product [Diatraea saccharalis]